MSRGHSRTIDLFVSKTRKKSNGCIEWTGLYDRYGYGRITFLRRRMGTHQFAYQQFIGSIPTGMLVLHTCDNPLCVNPSHLFTGTHKQNTEDMCRKGRQNFGGYYR